VLGVGAGGVVLVVVELLDGAATVVVVVVTADAEIPLVVKVDDVAAGRLDVVVVPLEYLAIALAGGLEMMLLASRRTTAPRMPADARSALESRRRLRDPRSASFRFSIHPPALVRLSRAHVMQTRAP
jgi:hypothetical protein